MSNALFTSKVEHLYFCIHNPTANPTVQLSTPSNVGSRSISEVDARSREVRFAPRTDIVS
jgi:hypothetical protein